MTNISKQYPKSVSQEFNSTNANPQEYDFPKENLNHIKCILDSRYWLNTKTKTCCVLLLTTSNNIKFKLAVFHNRTTRNYSPTTQIKVNFYVRNDLNLNDEIFITCSKSNKSENIYLREVIKAGDHKI